MKHLYEAVSTGMGFSYVRCYVWAEPEEAEAMAVEKLKSKGHDLQELVLLFSADSPAFVSKMDDEGFVMECDRQT